MLSSTAEDGEIETASIISTVGTSLNNSVRQQIKYYMEQQSLVMMKCPITQMRTFAYESSLRYHIRAHTGDKQFMCDQCGYASLTSSNLWAHKARAHTTEKNHICEVCGKAFNTKDRLKLHREIHSNRRDHICDQCGMAFRTKKKVREHKFVHTGLRPYVCLVCRKAFARKDALKEHGFIHSGEKRFHCEKCGHRQVRNRLSTLGRFCCAPFASLSPSTLGFASVTAG
uniref:C2H2-type domain-containing protein n=1 Tax=Timema tahoe TaxID=61484 RepID=A0A7R9FJD4_9NEOP|nr:unnamed protein product [Timema tahoe]